jgi:hypothetical protein
MAHQRLGLGIDHGAPEVSILSKLCIEWSEGWVKSQDDENNEEMDSANCLAET